MKELTGKIILKSSNLWRKFTVNEADIFDNVKLEKNLTLSLQISGVIWQLNFKCFNNVRILHKQTRFYHGNKTIVDEWIKRCAPPSPVCLDFLEV